VVAEEATGKVLVKATSRIKTINNRLTVVAKMMKVAVDWKDQTGLTALPCEIKLIKGDDSKEMGFLEHDVLDQLVDGAGKAGTDAHLAVLLGAEAGLRRGEILGAQWTDVVQGKLYVQRQVYLKAARMPDGSRAPRTATVTPTKGKSKRWVPLTPRLLQAIQKHRHLRAPWMLCQADGSPLTPKLLKQLIKKAEKRAVLPETGRTHILRHTFCSHLAMAGASPITIQNLAGHENLETTMRYMHLSPNATDEAVRLLVKSRESVASRGNIVATDSLK
jgi:integrase